MRTKIKGGAFLISLDFELMWGVFDKRTIQSYGDNILGGKKAIPKVLELFTKYRINATWATVGFIFNKDYQSLRENCASIQPNYFNEKLSSYKHMLNNDVGNLSPFYFAYDLIQSIKVTEGQELASHTYSHYYCLEDGQSEDSFDNDLKSAVLMAKKEQVELKSIVFPRNQTNPSYLKICVNNGIYYYRGNESNFLHKARSQKALNIWIRAARFLDSYFNLTGSNSFALNTTSILPVNIPASSFLRPFNRKLRLLERLKVYRIKFGMTYAAKNQLGYHLWWHPHNFGSNTFENLRNLESILKHFVYLKSRYAFESYTMNKLGELLYEE